MSRPHLIILMADQLRYDLLGTHTPNINGLLAQGCVFPRAYCASPLCVPARGSFFTGRYPNETGSIINPWREADHTHGYVHADMPNLYSLLDDKWDSWHVGKQHLLMKGPTGPSTRTHWTATQQDYARFLREAGKPKPGNSPLYHGIVPEMVGGHLTRAIAYSVPHTGVYEHGFDYFFDGFFTNGAIQAIRSRDVAKPLLLNVMFLAPHPPLQIPEPWYSQIRPGDIVLPENVGHWNGGQSPLQLYNLPGHLGTRYHREDWREIWRVYTGLVALLDHCIGLVLTELRQAGLYDESWIVFTSDHGEMLGSHRLWQKMCMYEESVHVPLVFKPPAGSPVKPSRPDDLVSHLDVLPTLCDLLDVAPPPNLPGVSLRATMERAEPSRREQLFIQFDGNGARGNFQRCLIRGRHKLIVDLFKDEVFFELYDLLTDPQEQHNLAWDQPKIVAFLLEALQTEMRRGGDLIHIPGDAYKLFQTNYGPNQALVDY